MKKCEDLQELIDDTLTALAELQGKAYEESFEYLLEASSMVADVLCEDGRFSILELISTGGSGEPDAYRIIFANPQESEISPRHGVKEIGFLHEPLEKSALSKAITEKKVIIANDVASNPLTGYIGIHIKNKGLKHMAVMPCGSYLLLFDRVSCRAPFTDEERRFLERSGRIILSGLKRFDDKEVEDVYAKVAGKAGDLWQLMAHLIKNPGLTIVGFSKRLPLALKEGDYAKALSYAAIIQQAGKRLTEDLGLIAELKSFLVDPVGEQPKTERQLSSYLKIFNADAFSVDPKLFENVVWLRHSEKLVEQMFMRIRNFMLGNRKDHDLGVRLAMIDHEKVSIEFTCTGFKRLKGLFDENYFCIRGIAETLGGAAEVSDDFLVITLPTV